MEYPDPGRIIQQEILLAKARELRKNDGEMQARIEHLSRSRERQLLFMLRLAQHEIQRQRRFLDDMNRRVNDIVWEEGL